MVRKENKVDIMQKVRLSVLIITLKKALWLVVDFSFALNYFLYFKF